MAKLLTQLVVAVFIWIGLGALGVPRVARLLVLVLGATLVHYVWERLFPEYFSPGSLPVADDDPLMMDALAKAQASMQDFLRLYPEHRTDSVVKFMLVTDQGVKEGVWADLVDISEGTARVYVRTPPVHQTAPFEPTCSVPVSEFIDWQIEFRDGSLRGGFTNQALFKAFERENGYLPPAMIPHLARFKELTPEERKSA